MSAFLQQLPALIGVVLGALGSYLAVVRGEQARFRRERTARWEERRLVVYADYAQALKKSVTLFYRVSAHLGNDPHPHPLSVQEAEPLLAEAMASRDPAWEALLLLGSPKVVENARSWVLTLIDMEQFVRQEARDPAAWAALLERQRNTRDAYYTTVRNDLALPPGHPGLWSPPALRR